MDGALPPSITQPATPYTKHLLSIEKGSMKILSLSETDNNKDSSDSIVSKTLFLSSQKSSIQDETVSHLPSKHPKQDYETVQKSIINEIRAQQ